LLGCWVAGLLRLQRMTRAQTCRGGMSGMRLGVCGTGEGVERRGEPRQSLQHEKMEQAPRGKRRTDRQTGTGTGNGTGNGTRESREAADRQPMGDSRILVSAARAAVSTGTKAPIRRQRHSQTRAGSGSGSLALPRSCCNVSHRPCAAVPCGVALPLFISARCISKHCHRPLRYCRRLTPNAACPASALRPDCPFAAASALSPTFPRAPSHLDLSASPISITSLIPPPAPNGPCTLPCFSLPVAASRMLCRHHPISSPLIPPPTPSSLRPHSQTQSIGNAIVLCSATMQPYLMFPS
jgi:hypothetical protein